MKVLIRAASALTSFLILYIVGFIFLKGIPNLNVGLFQWEYTSENVSLMPALINTILMTAISMTFAVPIGIFTAIFLAEYAKRGNKFVKFIRMAAETLSGIPSIVYGIFGMVFFVIALGWRYSLLAGALTMAIMILPLIMRTTEEALLSVPDAYREGSYGLGAGKLRTVFSISLPAAVPGILGGVILAIGRVVGETAALIYTAGTLARVAQSPMDSARTLSVHLFRLSGEALHINEAYATAVVLILLVLVINALSALIARKISRF
ncbi:MAG: phosphate ABC transporter permease PstA [Oscillospiraceae bacterium]|nr:phosphate ABC transporter permease PstA [Oscillospiraceae bacterium]